MSGIKEKDTAPTHAIFIPFFNILKGRQKIQVRVKKIIKCIQISQYKNNGRIYLRETSA